MHFEPSLPETMRAKWAHHAVFGPAWRRSVAAFDEAVKPNIITTTSLVAASPAPSTSGEAGPGANTSGTSGKADTMHEALVKLSEGEPNTATDLTAATFPGKSSACSFVLVRGVHKDGATTKVCEGQEFKLFIQAAVATTYSCADYCITHLNGSRMRKDKAEKVVQPGPARYLTCIVVVVVGGCCMWAGSSIHFIL